MVLSNCNYNIFTILILSLHCIWYAEAYTAAVVDLDFKETPVFIAQKLINSVKIFKEFIENAKQNGSDLIVFPELGVTSAVIVPKLPDHLELYSISKIEIEHVPCVEEGDAVLKNLSCYAKNNNIMVVVNLLEQTNNTDYYSTNVVFDNNGKIVSSYRRIHSNDDTHIKNGDKEGTFEATFGASSNVKFGVMISDDIFYPNKLLINKKVQNLIYTHAWKSEAPFLFAPSIQSGISKMYNVTLLASGYKQANSPYMGGSGVYTTKKGQLLKFTNEASSSLLIANLNDPKYPPQSKTTVPDNLPTENMTEYVLKPLTGTPQKICSCEEYCEVTYSMAGVSDYHYMLAMFSGVRKIGHKTVGYMVCGIVACSGHNHTDCGVYNPSSSKSSTFTELSVKIGKVNARSDQLLYIPSTLTHDLQPLDSDAYDVSTHADGSLEMVLKTGSKLLTFAFVVRTSEHDGMPVQTFNDANCKPNADGLGDGAIAAIVIGIIVAIIAAGVAALYFVRKRHRNFDRKY